MAFQQEKENTPGAHERRSSWTCDSLTISYASRRGTNRCRRCKGYLAEGELRFGMIFRSHNQHMLYQGFHLCCAVPPADLSCPESLEGIQDLMPQDVELIRRWIQTGAAPPPVLAISGPEIIHAAERQANKTQASKAVSNKGRLRGHLWTGPAGSQSPVNSRNNAFPDK